MLPIIEDEPSPRLPPRRWLHLVLPALAAVVLLAGVLSAERPSSDPVAGEPLPTLDERTGARLLALA
ncbi:MAG: hypothetical protein M3394_08765, partial [Actinomycetota bacterium]|nr:hypothetical protein [Actinomycetota bacterium]